MSYRHASPRHDPGLDIPAHVLVPTVFLGLLLVWLLLSSAHLVPSPAQLLLHMTTRLLGPSTASTLSTLPGFRPPTRPAHPASHRASPGGLWNTGNTCYQNSVLQALASCDSLPPFLDTLAAHPTAAALRALVRSLNALRGRRSEIPVRALTRTGKGWGWGEQQDAQEFLQGLFGQLEKEAAAATQHAAATHTVGVEAALDSTAMPRAPPDLRPPFEGLVAQRVGCLRCGFVESISLQPFTTLSLPLPAARATDLAACLAAYTDIEHIPDVECDKCTLRHLARHLTGMRGSLPPDSPLLPTVAEKLAAITTALDTDAYPPRAVTLPKNKTLSPKTKQLLIARAPNILILHLNRSHFNPLTGAIAKNHAAVRFPVVLSLPVAGELRTAPLDETMCRDMRRQRYALRSVVCHYGGHSSGHYICYRRWEGGWWRISDDDVERVPEAQVCAAGEAFMVFYEKEGAEEDAAAEEAGGAAAAGGVQRADAGVVHTEEPDEPVPGGPDVAEFAPDPDICDPPAAAPGKNPQLPTPDATPEPEPVPLPAQKENAGADPKKPRRRRKKSTPLVAVN